jgi:4'-phosphopantetheinyl transferase
VHVWYALLADLQPDIESLSICLTPAEQLRAARFILDRDRVAFTLAHGFQRCVLGWYPGAQPHPAGGREPGFSHARTPGAALCAVGAGQALGIDIERVQPLPDLEDLARSVLTPREQEGFAALPANLRDRAFSLLWVSKEAVLKLEGSGLGIDPRDLEVGPACWREPSFGVRLGERDFSVRTFGLADPYLAALATPREPRAVHLARFHFAHERQ